MTGAGAGRVGVEPGIVDSERGLAEADATDSGIGCVGSPLGFLCAVGFSFAGAGLVGGLVGAGGGVGAGRGLVGWGGGSEEVDAGVSLLDRCGRDPEGARELGWAGGWDSDAEAGAADSGMGCVGDPGGMLCAVG